MRMKVLLAMVALTICCRVMAVEVYSSYEERLGSTRHLASLAGDEAFGAKIDPATGEGVFYVPVLNIPGNNGLDISVAYRLGIRNVAGYTQWYFEQDEPYIGGSFSQALGWVTYSGSASRCSQANTASGKPPRVKSSNGRNGWFEPDEYWSGYQLSMPGGGGSSLRQLGSTSPVPLPTSGGPFHWAANDHWYFSCIALSTGTGEGFLGYSPDGLKYHFDTMRSTVLPLLNKFDSSGKDLDLDRYDIRIYAGKIEDRFGNYVSGLTASDGRTVTKTVSGNIVTFQYGARQWVVNTSTPYTVTYPDGSQWQASVAGTIQDTFSVKGGCPGAGPSTTNSTTTATIVSPSGATGTYLFKPTKIGYSYVPKACVPTDDGGSASVHPKFLIRTSLAQRTISGPGLQTSTLTISYGAANDCFLSECVSSSPTTRIVTYTEASGAYRKYTYGNRYFVNADLLLRMEEGQSSGAPLRTTDYEYSLLPRVGSYVGPISGTADYFPSSFNRVVNVSRAITEAGALFSWKVAKTCGTSGTDLCIDAFGRPTKVVKSRTPAA